MQRKPGDGGGLQRHCEIAFGEMYEFLQSELALKCVGRDGVEASCVLLSATACSWFMMRVRACTMRCRATAVAADHDSPNSVPRSAEKVIFQHQSQNQLRILAIRLLLPHSLGTDFGSVADPQLEVQLRHQPFKPARMASGFHPYTYRQGPGRSLPT
jgi:hypothetical protein